MAVIGNPVPLRSPRRLVQIRQQRSRCEPALERGGIDERLERRSGLTPRLRGAIEAARTEVAAADHGAHLTGMRVHRHQRRLQRIAHWDRSIATPSACLTLFDLLEPARDLALRCLLHVEVERRVDPEAALIHALPAELLDKLLTHFFLEV